MDWLVPTLFWVIYLAPIPHVCLTRSAGPWRMPAAARCPFSPRVGWLVIVVFLGPVGWLLFVFRPRRGS